MNRAKQFLELANEYKVNYTIANNTGLAAITNNMMIMVLRKDLTVDIAGTNQQPFPERLLKIVKQIFKI